MTTDESRQLFKELGLTYADAKYHTYLLMEVLKTHLKEHCKTSHIQMRLSKIVHFDDAKFANGGPYLYVNGDYFKRRECISFNRDGFIGFAGWASSSNLKPILNAFNYWCNAVAEYKIVKEAEK